jgi:Photosynthesis system II assembly factor YCF48
VGRKRKKTRANQPPFVSAPAKARARWPFYATAAGALAALVLVLALGIFQEGEYRLPSGIPPVRDYHSLLIDPADPQKLTLGTHNGLYVSRDGGTRWRFAALPADDAMNLTSSGAAKMLVAGHNVLKQSTDGGRTWSDVRASGLPVFDVHALAVDPRDESIVYAAVAGHGLYRSTDRGRSFERVSRLVGAAVMALGVTEDGRILAGDMNRGLLATVDVGARWKVNLRGPVFGIAVNPREPSRLLATGAGNRAFDRWGSYVALRAEPAGWGWTRCVGNEYSEHRLRARVQWHAVSLHGWRRDLGSCCDA